MKRTGIAVATVLGLVAAMLLTATPAPAQGMGVDGGQRSDRMRQMQQRMLGGNQWWNNPEIFEKLGLDEETRQKIDDEVYRAQQELITLRAEVERQNLELQRLLEARDKPDLNAVEEQAQRYVEARGEVQKLEIMMRAEIMHLLTAEQRSALEQHYEDRRQAFRDRALAHRPPPVNHPDQPGARPDDAEATTPDEPPPFR